MPERAVVHEHKLIHPGGAHTISVVVDGIVYGFQKFGGINTYFSEVLPRLALRHNVRVELLLPNPCIGTPPVRSIRALWRDLLPGRIGRGQRLNRFAEPVLKKINAALRELRIRKRRRCVFHSSYFTSVGAGTPQVAMVHDMNHELVPETYSDGQVEWLRGLYRDYLRRATRVIAVSQKTKNDVVRFHGVDPSIIDVVYHAASREVFWPERDPDRLRRLCSQVGLHMPYVLFVGWRTQYKNFDRLLPVFARPNIKNNLSLAVVGEPWLESEEQCIRSLGLESKVRLFVYPTDEDLRTLYSFAAGFMFPSYHEGFGIPLLEAMACGAPVLASNIAVFREVAGNAALFFDPYDDAAMERALEAVLDGPTQDEYRARGFEQVQKYSWERCADQTYQVYRKALGLGEG